MSIAPEIVDASSPPSASKSTTPATVSLIPSSALATKATEPVAGPITSPTQRAEKEFSGKLLGATMPSTGECDPQSKSMVASSRVESHSVSVSGHHLGSWYG